MKRKPSTSGFTLIELVLVLLIIAIGVGVAVVRLRDSARGQVIKDTTNQILALMRHGRQEAISQGHIFRLNFDENSYWLTVQNFGSEPQNLESEMGRTFTLPEGIALETNIDETDGSYIEFRPNGRTMIGEILIRDQFGKVIRLICESPTEAFHLADQ